MLNMGMCMYKSKACSIYKLGVAFLIQHRSMSSNKGKRGQTSLCEKSMQIVVNIMKASTLSLAKISLAPTAGPMPSGGLLADQALPVAAGESTKKFQEPESERKNPSYLMEPYEGGNSLKVVKDVNEVDLKALSYISKVHERNRRASRSSRLKVSTLIIPPPPVLK